MKITIPRIFDSARILAKPFGKDIEDFVSFSQQAFEQIIRALRNQITFEDNIKCQVLEVTLKHDLEQVLFASGRVKGIIVTRVFSDESITSYKWKYNDKSELIITPRFLGADTEKKVNVTLILLQE